MLATCSCRIAAIALAAGLCTALVGCQALTTQPDYDVVELSELSAIVNALKEELRAYSRWDVAGPSEQKSEVGISTASAVPATELCQDSNGRKNDVQIVAAKVSITAKSTSSASAGLGLPQIERWTITGPDGKRAVTNEQKFEFDVGVVEMPEQSSRKVIVRGGPEWSEHALAAVIWKLREGILAIDHRKPCVAFTTKNADGKQIPHLMPLTLGFQAVKTVSGGVKVTIVPVPLALSAAGSRERTSGQTITLMLQITGSEAASLYNSM